MVYYVRKSIKHLNKVKKDRVTINAIQKIIGLKIINLYLLILIKQMPDTPE